MVPSAKSTAKYALEAVRALMPTNIQRPVFVIAPPRSGSTLLFNILAGFDEFTCFEHREAEHLWWRAYPYAKRPDVCDQILPAEFGIARRRRVQVMMRTEAVTARRGVGYLSGLTSLDPIRYLDKTISNCFHLELLSEMFPDLTYVFLVRDPRASIASMIEGWPDLERFGKAALTPYLKAANGSLSHWTYPAPPGWRSAARCDVPQVCAWSWVQHVDRIAERIQQGDGTLLRYEDLVADPLATVMQLAEALEDFDESRGDGAPARTAGQSNHRHGTPT